MLKCQGPN